MAAQTAGSSVIGRGTTVRGNVRSDVDLEIQGRVDGSVACKGDLVIGESALIKSDISGRRIVIRGAVAGDVTGDESILLEEGAKVVGDLGAPSIGIRPGALVRGNVSTEGLPGAGASRSRAEAAAGDGAARRRPVEAARSAPDSSLRSEVRAPVARPAAPAKAAAPAPHAAGNNKPAPAAVHRPGPPPPVVPSLKKGAKGALKRKGAR